MEGHDAPGDCDSVDGSPIVISTQPGQFYVFKPPPEHFATHHYWIGECKANAWQEWSEDETKKPIKCRGWKSLKWRHGDPGKDREVMPLDQMLKQPHRAEYEGVYNISGLDFQFDDTVDYHLLKDIDYTLAKRNARKYLSLKLTTKGKKTITDLVKRWRNPREESNWSSDQDDQ